MNGRIEYVILLVVSVALLVVLFAKGKVGAQSDAKPAIAQTGEENDKTDASTVGDSGCFNDPVSISRFANTRWGIPSWTPPPLRQASAFGRGPLPAMLNG